MILFFKPLRNTIFFRLYIAETISLLGDAFTWVGIALLAYQFDRDHSATILSIALTLRVTAFIVFGPYAGVLADRIDRKKILYITHFFRMAIVACLPFVRQVWQVYGLIFLLNIFNAFFTPAYKAAIPQSIQNEKDYDAAISLSTATYQLLGILGPGLAGIAAAWLGVRQIFFIDAVSFVLAALLILTLPKLIVDKIEPNEKNILQDISKGSRLLFTNKIIRFALLMELVAAIGGAQILVNTVGHIKGTLMLDNKHYGWVMASFGIGASLAAIIAGYIKKTKARINSLIGGSILLILAIALGNIVTFILLFIFWFVAGFGQTLTEMPSQFLIAEHIPQQKQGKVYGAHFAWSHLWWAFAYPIAGITGRWFQQTDFLIGSVIAIFIFIMVCLLLFPNKKPYIFRSP